MAVEVRDNREDPGVKITWVLTLVGSFMILVVASMIGLHRYYRVSFRPHGVSETLGSFPIPEIQPNPTQDLRGFLKRQNQQLAGYAWVDHSNGLIHIPIERAMDFVVSRGLAALDPPGQSSTRPNGAAAGMPPDGAPRAAASLSASPYGARP